MKFINKTVDYHFLIRVIKNEVSLEEQEYFNRWLLQSDLNKEKYGELLLLWDKMGNAQVPHLPSQTIQWENISEIINSSHASERKLPQIKKEILTPFRRRLPRVNWAFVFQTAVLIIIVTGLSIVLNNQPQQTVTEITEEIPIKVKESTVTTAKGEMLSIPLSDGTIVYLNADSKISYPNIFNSVYREVVLTGEAYFSVRHNPEMPFRVRCGKTVTMVTGTEFNIKSRNNKVNVTVVKGSVKAFSEKTTEGVSVKKGEMVSLSRSGYITSPVKVNLAHYLAWKMNKLSFAHTPLKEAMAEIERCYNMEVIFTEDSLKNRTITGVFDNSSLDDILSVMSLTLDIKIYRDGKKIIVH